MLLSTACKKRTDLAEEELGLSRRTRCTRPSMLCSWRRGIAALPAPWLPGLLASGTEATPLWHANHQQSYCYCLLLLLNRFVIAVHKIHAAWDQVLAKSQVQSELIAAVHIIDLIVLLPSPSPKQT